MDLHASANYSSKISVGVESIFLVCVPCRFHVGAFVLLTQGFLIIPVRLTSVQTALKIPRRHHLI